MYRLLFFVVEFSRKTGARDVGKLNLVGGLVGVGPGLPPRASRISLGAVVASLSPTSVIVGHRGDFVAFQLPAANARPSSAVRK